MLFAQIKKLEILFKLLFMIFPHYINFLLKQKDMLLN